MMMLKACPRCRRGDLFVEHDEHGLVLTCLQCGYTGDLDVVRRLVAAPAVIRLALGRETVEAA